MIVSRVLVNLWLGTPVECCYLRSHANCQFSVPYIMATSWHFWDKCCEYFRASICCAHNGFEAALISGSMLVHSGRKLSRMYGNQQNTRCCSNVHRHTLHSWDCQTLLNDRPMWDGGGVFRAARWIVQCNKRSFGFLQHYCTYPGRGICSQQFCAVLSCPQHAWLRQVYWYLMCNGYVNISCRLHASKCT